MKIFKANVICNVQTTSKFNTLFCVLPSKNKVGNLLQDYAVLNSQQPKKLLFENF